MNFTGNKTFFYAALTWFVVVVILNLTIGTEHINGFWYALGYAIGGAGIVAYLVNKPKY